MIYWGEKYSAINAPVFLGYNRDGGLGVRENYLQMFRNVSTGELVVFHVGKVDLQARFNHYAGIASDHDYYSPDEIFDNLVADSRKHYKQKAPLTQRGKNRD